MCFTLFSCSKTHINDNNSTNNSIISTETNPEKQVVDNKNEDNSVTKANITFNGKNVKDIQVFAMGNKIDMEFSELKPLLTIEDEGEPVKGVNSKSVFGNVKLIYEDGSEFEFGEIIIGDDNVFYLKLYNGNYYKMADGSFLNAEETTE